MKCIHCTLMTLDDSETKSARCSIKGKNFLQIYEAFKKVSSGENCLANEECPFEMAHINQEKCPLFTNKKEV